MQHGFAGGVSVPAAAQALKLFLSFINQAAQIRHAQGQAAYLR